MASITDQARWQRVLNHIAADLKAEVILAGLRGIIPNPIDALRINVTKRAGKDAPVKLYTVPENKIFFLFSSSCCFTTATEKGKSFVQVIDAEDVLLYHLHSSEDAPINSQHITAKQYFPALPLVYGDYIYASVESIYQYARATIHGWEEDV